MRILNKKGNIAIVIMLYVITFAATANILELSLLQRIENKRYIEQNNSLYTADSFMDIYIYACLDLITAPTSSFVFNPALEDQGYASSITSMNNEIFDDEEGQLKLPMFRDILQTFSLDNAMLKAEYISMASDQVVMTHKILNKLPLQVDMRDIRTVQNFELEDKLYLKPIVLEYTMYYKGYTVAKTISVYGLYLEWRSNRLSVNESRMQIIVEDYDCYA